MATFAYKGPGETTTFGITFSKGEPVEVMDELAIRKLTNNPCFETVQEKDKALAVAAVLPFIKAATTLEELEKFKEGETRATVLAAIEKQAASFQK